MFWLGPGIDPGHFFYFATVFRFLFVDDTRRPRPVRDLLSKIIPLAKLLADDLHNVVGMTVALGEDQSLGHLETSRKDFGEQMVAKGLDDRADLIFGDHAAVEFIRRVFEVVIQLLPADLAG